MKVLFVSSGNKKNMANPIISRQGESLVREGILIDYYLIKGRGMWGYFNNIKLLRAFLMLNHYDVIHAHYGMCGIVSILARSNEKIVVSLMGDDILGSRKKSGKNTVKGNLLVSINRIASKFYDYTIVKSKEMRQALGPKSNSSSIIPNGVDLSVFYRVNRVQAIERVGWSVNDINILYLGDPSRTEKNYKLAYAACELLKNSILNLKLHVVNSIPTDELKYYYSAANVVVLTSFHEGSPNVIKEAMACGCPIVATDVGDISWLFEQTAGCFLADFSAEGFSDVLQSAIKYSLSIEVSEGRKRLNELHLDSGEVARQIIMVYKNLIK